MFKPHKQWNPPDFNQGEGVRDEELKKINEELHKDFSHDDIICAKVYDDHGKVIATAIAFNQHNGYYAHSVEALENGKIIYEIGI